MYVDFVRKMPSDDDKYSSQVKILAANNTMHAVNPVYQNDAFDESLDDKDTTDYVVMSSQARPSTIDETENTDYVVMSSQARQSNIDETENTGYVVVSSQARQSSIEDTENTDYVVMKSQAGQSNIDETGYIVVSSQARQSSIEDTENTDYVVMRSQARKSNTDETKIGGSDKTKKVSRGSSKSVDVEKAESEDNLNHQSRRTDADDIKLLKNPVNA